MLELEVVTEPVVAADDVGAEVPTIGDDAGVAVLVPGAANAVLVVELATMELVVVAVFEATLRPESVAIVEALELDTGAVMLLDVAVGVPELDIPALPLSDVEAEVLKLDEEVFGGSKEGEPVSVEAVELLLNGVIETVPEFVVLELVGREEDEEGRPPYGRPLELDKIDDPDWPP